MTQWIEELYELREGDPEVLSLANTMEKKTINELVKLIEANMKHNWHRHGDKALKESIVALNYLKFLAIGGRPDSSNSMENTYIDPVKGKITVLNFEEFSQTLTMLTQSIFTHEEYEDAIKRLESRFISLGGIRSGGSIKNLPVTPALEEYEIIFDLEYLAEDFKTSMYDAFKNALE